MRLLVARPDLGREGAASYAYAGIQYDVEKPEGVYPTVLAHFPEGARNTSVYTEGRYPDDRDIHAEAHRLIREYAPLDSLLANIGDDPGSIKDAIVSRFNEMERKISDLESSLPIDNS